MRQPRALARHDPGRTGPIELLLAGQHLPRDAELCAPAPPFFAPPFFAPPAATHRMLRRAQAWPRVCRQSRLNSQLDAHCGRAPPRPSAARVAAPGTCAAKAPLAQLASAALLLGRLRPQSPLRAEHLGWHSQKRGKGSCLPGVSPLLPGSRALPCLSALCNCTCAPEHGLRVSPNSRAGTG